MAEEIKKSYNPFKMWGSWIGLGIPVLWAVLVGSIIELSDGHFFISIIHTMFLYKPGMTEFGFFGFILIWGVLISSFLIGWGIHSLIRKAKN